MIDPLIKAIEGKENQDIVIIGKGRSIDEISLHSLKNFIIINVNDSEVIIPGQVCVFHHEWVREFFKGQNPKANLYVTDKAFNSAQAILMAKYVPYDPETSDFLLERFFHNDIFIEQSIIVSALKIANKLSLLLNVRKKVYLLGFDFSTSEGFSKNIVDNQHGLEKEYVQNAVKNQENIFECIMHQKEKLNIDIIHVGSKMYSFYSVESFNGILAKSSNKFNISKLQECGVNFQNEVKVVAEITTNHFGDWNRLEAMIIAAKIAGADFIKLQKRDVQTFYSKEQLEMPYVSPFGDTFGDYRNGIELDFDQILKVKKLCFELGIGWFMSILDMPSFEFVSQFNPDIIKLPSTISEKKDYLKAVGNNFTGDIVISTGFTDKEYEKFILENFKKAKSIYLLQCNSAYPTPMFHAQIGVVRHYYNLSKLDERIIPGYSSHDTGSLCSMLAVAAGARMIEKHVKYGNVNWSHFDQVALNLLDDEFKQFVSDIRKAEKIVGGEQKEIMASEHHKY